MKYPLYAALSSMQMLLQDGRDPHSLFWYMIALIFSKLGIGEKVVESSSSEFYRHFANALMAMKAVPESSAKTELEGYLEKIHGKLEELRSNNRPIWGNATLISLVHHANDIYKTVNELGVK